MNQFGNTPVTWKAALWMGILSGVLFPFSSLDIRYDRFLHHSLYSYRHRKT